MAQLAKSVLIIIAALMFHGCCTCKQSEREARLFSIELSSGGGVSGMSTGFVLSSAGTVTYWREFRGAKEEERTIGKVSSEAIEELRRLTAEHRLDTLSLNETGNMTTFIRVTNGRQHYSLAWPGIDSDESAVPPKVLPVYRKLQAVLEAYRDQLFEKK